MIFLDVNVLVRAHRADFPGSQGTKAWLEDALAGDEPVAVWDQVLISAFRVLSNPKYVREMGAAERAMDFLQVVRGECLVLNPGSNHWGLFKKLVAEGDATGNLVTNAAIAAVTIEHGCRLATFDRDFARFRSLRWFEPAV